MTQVLAAAAILAWLLVFLLLWWGAQHAESEYRRGYRAGRASIGSPALCDVLIAVPGGQGSCGRPAGHLGAHASAWTEGPRRW